MKRLVHYFKKTLSSRSLIALGLGALSLIVLLIAFQLNFRQQQLYTQVVRMAPDGQQEVMIYRDYRDIHIEQVQQILSDCLQRNELFGDGTGMVCDIYREQLSCIEDALSQSELLFCLQ